MSWRFRFLALVDGKAVRLPAAKMDRNEPVLPGLDGCEVVCLDAAVLVKNRVPQVIGRLWLYSAPVREGRIVYELLAQVAVQKMGSVLGGILHPDRPENVSFLPDLRRRLTPGELKELLTCLKRAVGEAAYRNTPVETFEPLLASLGPGPKKRRAAEAVFASV